MVGSGTKKRELRRRVLCTVHASSHSSGFSQFSALALSSHFCVRRVWWASLITEGKKRRSYYLIQKECIGISKQYDVILQHAKCRMRIVGCSIIDKRIIPLLPKKSSVATSHSFSIQHARARGPSNQQPYDFIFFCQPSLIASVAGCSVIILTIRVVNCNETTVSTQQRLCSNRRRPCVLPPVPLNIVVCTYSLNNTTTTAWRSHYFTGTSW